MGKYFGTDGFRGYVGKTLHDYQAYKIGSYLGYIFRGKKILIGMDTRISGKMLSENLIKGITEYGTNIYDMGITTTPSISYITLKEGFSCGIMITASHNPYYDNGIKLINSNGEKMEEEFINEVEKYMDGEIEIEKTKNCGSYIKYDLGKELYINHLINSAIDLKDFKIILDLANGSATSCAKEVFLKLNANLKVINNNPDGKNINTNCGSTHMEGLQEEIKKDKYDIGFAFDGDADRCLLVNSKGVIYNGDHILYILGNYLKKKNELNKNTVVTTIMSNFGLYKAFDIKDINYDKTKVGDKYVYESMKENDFSVGGEQSGHIIIKKYAKTGDGILTALQILKIMKEENKNIDELTKDLKIYPQVLINVFVKNKKEVLNDIDIINKIKEVENILKDTGRILVRPSGTEELVRVMVEADSLDKCEKYCNLIVNLIKEKEL